MVAGQQLSPRRQPNECHTGEFALLLVQEWLVASKLEETARCLEDECAREDRSIPVRALWNRMTASLGFGPRSPATGGKRSQGDTTLLEATLRKVIEQNEKDAAQVIRNQPLQQQVVLMSKKPASKFVSRRFLPRSAGRSNNAQEGSPELPSPQSSLKLRPKSAFVCKSTSDLISKTMESEASSLPSSKSATLLQQRPISAASVLTPHRDSQARKTSSLRGVESNSATSRSPLGSNALHGVMEAVAAVAVNTAASKAADRQSSIMVRASLPHIAESNGNDTTKANATDGVSHSHRHEDDDDGMQPQRTPTLSLEEMSEVRLMEEFGSISRAAIKKLRRVLAKSHACTQEFEKSQRTLDRIKARAKLHQLRRVLAEEQTELLSSTMASITSEPCSLCLHVFPKTNLTTKVSHKSIVDLRAAWAAANKNAVDGGIDDSGDPKEASPEAMNHARLTHLYDEAPVCAFCSQLVLNYSSYRPSSAERRAQEIQEKRTALKSLRSREASERRNLERCDPLDFNSYELNSDDDSDVEEVVEVNPEGRPQVVRRRRRRTMRTPVRLGVVSKRLHYDTLRSDSLHMLTLDEWKKITK